MLRSRLLSGAAVLAALVVGLMVTERDAHARYRRCCNGYGGYRNGYAYNNYYGGGHSTYSTNYGSTGCNQVNPPTNPDGSIAPQPGSSTSPNAPPPAPAPTPPSALN